MIVESAASAGESYFWDGAWVDLTTEDSTANFCIKALTKTVGLSVAPAENLRSEGPVGGPFSPDDASYSFEYRGAASIDYEVTTDSWVDWLTVSGDTGGTLPPNTPASALVEVNANAASLSEGTHTATVYFTNLTDHVGDTTREVSLSVGDPSKHYEWTLDSDPGWTSDGQWAHGAPTGGGGEYGNADPTSGYTGDNVYGYNLSGDYANGLDETHLTSGPIDCSGLGAVSVRFWRWLGVEQPLYDHAYVRVSNDGTNWVTVWENVGGDHGQLVVADGPRHLRRGRRRGDGLPALDDGHDRRRLEVLRLEHRRHRDLGPRADPVRRRRRAGSLRETGSGQAEPVQPDDDHRVRAA